MKSILPAYYIIFNILLYKPVNNVLKYPFFVLIILNFVSLMHVTQLYFAINACEPYGCMCMYYHNHCDMKPKVI